MLRGNCATGGDTRLFINDAFALYGPVSVWKPQSMTPVSLSCSRKHCEVEFFPTRFYRRETRCLSLPVFTVTIALGTVLL